MAQYNVIAVTVDQGIETKTVIPGPAVGPSLIEVPTAKGLYKVQVGQQAFDTVEVAGPEEGKFVTQLVPKSWDESCALVADQVVASLGAP